ncbi:hypothetical protein EZS27_029698 [termite gut metagenome]|uniref:Uncharacterized protein n=1 Tax=termite gut metagenome TaxID=433724 RepID=A0A5J4QJ55_9ZZZZ
MIADKLAKTSFTKIILFAGGFPTVFLYFCALAIGAMEGYGDVHVQK